MGDRYYYEDDEGYNENSRLDALERKFDILLEVDVHAHGSFDQVVQVALKFEKYDKVSSASGYPKPTFKNSFAPKGEISKPIVKDDKGKAPMHFPSKDDHNKMGNRKTCYKCRGYGHFANECPNSRAMMILEMDDDEYEDEKRDFGHKGEAIGKAVEACLENWGY
uniref:CCHC-type domain-containing protein n=1 Tax=Chenopodium quinoa TaxID=63459 RepID=A0A803MWP3_CHEQI